MTADIPAFLINLDRSSDRLAAMTARLGALGLHFTRTPAIDGRALSASDLEKVCPDRRWWRERRLLTAAEIGCALSHKRALEQVVASGAPVALVLEDDVVFSHAVISALVRASAVLGDKDAVAKLEGVAQPNDLAPTAASADVPCFGLARSPLLGAAAYVLTRGAARKVLSRLDRIDRPFDHVLIEYTRNDVELYEVRPFPAWQEATASTIGDDREAPDERRSLLYRWRKRGWKIAEGARLRCFWGRRRGLIGWLTGLPPEPGTG